MANGRPVHEACVLAEQTGVEPHAVGIDAARLGEHGHQVKVSRVTQVRPFAVAGSAPEFGHVLVAAVEHILDADLPLQMRRDAFTVEVTGQVRMRLLLRRPFLRRGREAGDQQDVGAGDVDTVQPRCHVAQAADAEGEIVVAVPGEVVQTEIRSQASQVVAHGKEEVALFAVPPVVVLVLALRQHPVAARLCALSLDGLARLPLIERQRVVAETDGEGLAKVSVEHHAGELGNVGVGAQDLRDQGQGSVESRGMEDVRKLDAVAVALHRSRRFAPGALRQRLRRHADAAEEVPLNHDAGHDPQGVVLVPHRGRQPVPGHFGPAVGDEAGHSEELRVVNTGPRPQIGARRQRVVELTDAIGFGCHE